MKKEQKSAIVQRLTANLGRAKMALVAEHRGMTAGESDDMRRRLRAIDGELQVAKNTLMRRALKQSDFAALEAKLGGPIGLIVSYADAVELAKAVGSFRELGEKFKVRGGVLDGKPLTAEEITALAQLPPREVVFAQLLGLLQAPATRLARLLNEPGSGLARLLDAIGKKAGASVPAAE
ncbi:MAG: 50S ribosomal protein L10 [Candidatus Binataceae bacterium]